MPLIRRPYSSQVEEVVNLPTPPAGKKWWRKPYSQTHILLTEAEYNKREGVSENYLCERTSCQNDDQSKFEIVDGVAYCQVCDYCARKV